MRRAVIAWALVTGLLAAVPSAGAAEDSLIVGFDNDLLVSTDRYYTSGLFLGAGYRDGPLRIRVLVGQEIYTPRYIEIAEDQVFDRPWAGFLYARGSVIHTEADRAVGGGVRLGVVGPAALAEQVQELAHMIVPADEPTGWPHQLSNRPAIEAWAGYAAQVRVDLGTEFGLRLASGLGVEVGSVRNRLTLSATIDIGLHLEDGVSFDIREPVVVADRGTSGLRIYLSLGGVVRVTVTDLFVDGANEQPLGLRPLSGVFRPGLVFAYDNVQLGLRYSLRSKVFAAQTASAHYGSADLEIGF
ncbi:MAG: lipid A-modifier LpxR family protein [Myxococcota bacterium]